MLIHLRGNCILFPLSCFPKNFSLKWLNIPFAFLLSLQVTFESTDKSRARAPSVCLSWGGNEPIFSFSLLFCLVVCQWALWHGLGRLRVPDCAQLVCWTNWGWEMCQGMIQDAGEMSQYCAVMRNMEVHMQEDRDHWITLLSHSKLVQHWI